MRVTLNLINKASEMNGTPPEALVILWRSLTIMKPSSSGDFDPQAQALARMYYFEQEGQFKGKLGITKELATLFKATPPTGSEEPTLCECCWNTVAFGVQAELDKAEKALMDEAIAKSKNSSKGYSMGGQSPLVVALHLLEQLEPLPIPMVLEVVEAISYSLDEYCDSDKFSKADLKVGDYRAATFCGAPAAPPQGPSFRPFHSSTLKGSPSPWKGQNEVSKVSSCSLSPP